MTIESIPLLETRQTPFFGHQAAFRADRVGLLEEVRQRCGDLGRIRLGPISVVVVTAPGPALEVLQHRAEDFQKSRGLGVLARPLLGQGLLSSEGELHRARRKLIAPTFYKSAIGGYGDTILKATAETLDGLVPGQTIDVGEVMMALTLKIVGRTLFHAEVEGQTRAVGQAFTAASEALVAQLGSPLPLPWPWPSAANLRLRRAAAALHQVVEAVIVARKRSQDPAPDLLRLLLEMRDEGGQGLSSDALRDEVVTLFLAGHETTANALTWAFDQLDRHPKVAARLAAEAQALDEPLTANVLPRLPYALAVLKETMRLYPPAYFVGRRALRDTQLSEHRLPKGTTVFVAIREVHRRPELYPEPELFRPERFLDGAEERLPKGAFLPFGAGPRICIGNHFALMEGQLILAAVARRFGLRRPKFQAPLPLDPLITLRPGSKVELQVTSAFGQPLEPEGIKPFARQLA